MTSRHVRLCRAWVLALGLPACAAERADPELTPASRTLTAPRATLTSYGSLSDLMQLGRTGPAVWLRKMGDDPSLVGIGMLSGLRGEVAVVGGRVWLGYATDATNSHGRTLDGADESAAFLAVASVPEWRTFSLATGERSDGLAGRLQKLSRDVGLDASRLIPVVITGRLLNLRYHVADGRGMRTGDPIAEKDLVAVSSKGYQEDADGVLVGFFSTGVHPAILQPELPLHLHVVIDDIPAVGHVDWVDLDAGARVRLPMAVR
jgi:hypothetical protein